MIELSALMSLVVFNVICGFIWNDHGIGYELSARDIFALAGLSVVWPIGMAFVVLIGIEHYRESQTD